MGRLFAWTLLFSVFLVAATESTARGFLRRHQNIQATGEDVLEEDASELEPEPSFGFYTYAYRDRSLAGFIRDGSYPVSETGELADLATEEHLPDVNASIDSEISLPFLHFAIWHGRVSLVQALLARGANPNARDYNGWTAGQVFAHRRDEISHLLSPSDLSALQAIFSASISVLDHPPSNASTSADPGLAATDLSNGLLVDFRTALLIGGSS